MPDPGVLVGGLWGFGGLATTSLWPYCRVEVRSNPAAGYTSMQACAVRIERLSKQQELPGRVSAWALVLLASLGILLSRRLRAGM